MHAWIKMPKLKKQNKTKQFIHVWIKMPKLKKKKLGISEKNKLKECGVKELIKVKVEIIYTEI